MKKLPFLALLALLLFACSKDASELALESGKSGSITRFAVYRNYMYVLNLNEVQTYDLTDREHPALVHRLATDYGLETITVYDSTVFLGSTRFLYILDISNPAAPVIQAKSDRVVALNLGGCDPVVVKGNFAYSTVKIIENVCGSVSSQSALVVYDVTDKSNPVNIGLYLLDLPNGLGYKDNYLFVCDEGADRILLFDISDPHNLVLLPQNIGITDPYDLIIDGEKMIVSTKTDFAIFNIADVTQIVKIGQITR